MLQKCGRKITIYLGKRVKYVFKILLRKQNKNISGITCVAKCERNNNIDLEKKKN